MDVSDLEKALLSSWCRESSQDSQNWSPNNPAYGQSEVTVLIVNDYMGGVILKSKVILPDNKQTSHYFNLAKGKEIDLTLRQFPQGTKLTEFISIVNGHNSIRDYILANASTKNCYETLKKRVENLLK